MSNNENKESLPDAKETFNELVGICKSTCKGTKKMKCLQETLKDNVNDDRNTLCALKAELKASKEHNNVSFIVAMAALLLSTLTALITAVSEIFGDCIVVNVWAGIILIAAVTDVLAGLFLCIKLMKVKKNSYIEIALEEYESRL